ncbi:MAG: cytochrome c [Deltaproteobacteria bacterium]|nr:MAG: cytochrome c [Deltaproteobacteria bacterium]
MSRRRKIAIAAGVLVVVAVVLGVLIKRFMDRNRAPMYADIQEHFKYGSIGTEKRLGVPAPLFDLFPVMFADLLPQDRPGQGYEKLGFLYEPGHKRPIGTTVREMPVEIVGLNCAACHTGTMRDKPGGERRLLLGAPANNFNIEGYFLFILAIAEDPRFTTERLLEGIERQDPDFGTLDRLIYRYVVLPQVEKAFKGFVTQYAWLKQHPPFGPGRVDTFNPYKVYHHLAMDDSIGTADFPALYNQKPRIGMHLHWDGNNDVVEERNISAAIGAGAEPSSLDIPQMMRIRDWTLTVQGPAFPADRIDHDRATRGEAIWRAQCADCHAFGGKKVGQVTPVGDVGTDAERERSFTAELADKQNTLGTGYPWKLSHFRKTGGYANAPLDRVWLRSPYLHNGSVPTLRALLFPDERPAQFYRAYDVYDFDNAGYVSNGPEAEKLGWKYDTTVRGNTNRGHRYGTELPADQKLDLIEYLKTL